MKRANALGLAVMSLGMLVLPVDRALPVGAGDPFAFFALRLAPGQSDAILNISDPADNRLELELYAGIGNVPPGVFIQAYTFYLHANTPGVLTFADDFSGPLFDLGCFENGLNNTPNDGDFSYACFDLDGVSAGIGITALYATMSVEATGTGTVTYAFVDDAGPMRPSAISLTDGQIVEDDNMAYVIASNMVDIEVVDIRSDVDNDGDTDLRDFAVLQQCNGSLIENALPAECNLLDFNLDQTIDQFDRQIFIQRITGPDWVVGDLDADHDADLVDLAALQRCMHKTADFGQDTTCELADVNGDGWTDQLDWDLVEAMLTGPPSN